MHDFVFSYLKESIEAGGGENFYGTDATEVAPMIAIGGTCHDDVICSQYAYQRVTWGALPK